ncbi:hypothetical protein Tco_0331948 [Tanacetum coccineum]
MNMRQQRWLDLLKDYDCETRYHPSKANVVADALSIKDRNEVTKISSLRMIVTSDLFDKIKLAHEKALKEENWKSKCITSYIPHLVDDSRGIKTRFGRVYIPFRSDIKDLLLEEVHKSKNKGKLSPRFIGPFKILKRDGEVAYVLELPEEMKGSHNTFHVSYLRKCLADETSVVTLDDIKIYPELTSQEEPEAILGRKMRQLKNK